ncbi:MAG: hypothetical protein QOF27_2221 [Gaiellaceae bacterium]|nr:hypothetical protein [Gaiellaceae bacterium]
MSSMPPQQPPPVPPAPEAPTTAGPVAPPPAGYGGGYGGIGRVPTTGAILPVPGNAELAIWLLAEIVLAIVAATARDFDSHGWAVASTWLTAAYLISRGLAKASRVLEQ